MREQDYSQTPIFTFNHCSTLFLSLQNFVPTFCMYLTSFLFPLTYLPFSFSPFLSISFTQFLFLYSSPHSLSSFLSHSSVATDREFRPPFLSTHPPSLPSQPRASLCMSLPVGCLVEIVCYTSFTFLHPLFPRMNADRLTTMHV